ncbi:MAG TPA: Na+:solute symporter [Spirochaetota bacterium]|nr:Na+:solute symporter [Spirochaetota bacterium]HPI89114.1 Na+:solute symporter [Spirochaetota bacterium]HPR48868.1 Na+:solute symporter [Spirochaetota bacterium]
MPLIDIAVITLYFLVVIVIAFALARRGGRSTEDFFLSGRKLPWWIAGTTMVATTFAADTPLAVTELVATRGIAGNWLWWNMVAGNILAVFFFAKLWRRSGIMTDVEFIELRYSGPEAAFLRGFKALYLGVFLNAIIMGWVNVALAEILKNIFGISGDQVIYYILGAMLVVGIYSSVSGLWGIAFTDMFQFIIAMAGCIVLAGIVISLPEIGGVAGLKAKLPADYFRFVPRIGSGASAAAGGILTLSFSAFIAHIAIQWWSSWYPGSEPGGGGYVAQRMMSAKDERHSMLATLWFTVAHFALRPWPWIIVALCSLVLYPGLGPDEKKAGFIMAMRDHLPPGLLGLLVAAFLAAYMSTISTHLNWGTSYLVNDFYRRFIKKDADERHYVFASRVFTLVLMLVSSMLIFVINSISGAWSFIIECGAGLGLVLILRWYWWRVSAWSEISAMIAPFAGYTLTRYVLHISFPESLFFIVGLTTIVWLAVTFLTRPVDRETLESFNERVRPGGPGWRTFTSAAAKGRSQWALFVNWILGIGVVYTALFSIGRIILQEYVSGVVLLAVTAVLCIMLNISLSRDTD